MQALLAAADNLIDGKPDPPAEAGAAKEGQTGESLDGDTVAEMAAGWCRTFAANPRFGSTAEYGLSGLAAAVILSATPRSPAPPLLFSLYPTRPPLYKPCPGARHHIRS